ncbi:hypothetical protein BDZ45DRAFT_740301 [Acephala macrosclerotiorum]|nr:hypothetical protein BDZ45DRAFT_740301 [Acephala macrosclerotiorum]
MTSIASSNSLACTQPCRPQIALIGYQSHFCLVPLLRISKVRLCFRTFEPLKPATLIPTLSTMLLCFRGLFIRHCSVNGNTFKDIVQRTHHVKEFNIARKGLIHEPELVRKQRYNRSIKLSLPASALTLALASTWTACASASSAVTVAALVSNSRSHLSITMTKGIHQASDVEDDSPPKGEGRVEVDGHDYTRSYAPYA